MLLVIYKNQLNSSIILDKSIRTFEPESEACAVLINPWFPPHHNYQKEVANDRTFTYKNKM